jgi:hypothetical protein
VTAVREILTTWSGLALQQLGPIQPASQIRGRDDADEVAIACHEDPAACAATMMMSSACPDLRGIAWLCDE